MRSRLTSSHFVGRGPELAELLQAAHDAGAGRPGLVLLGGDSGVGKTRLVSELEQRLHDEEEDALVLRGDGVEQADGELPYAPLLSALRPLVRANHPALAALSAGSRAQLARILPGLEDERGRDEHTPNDQLRLFEAVLELIDRIGEEAPLILILEDMHWADRSTRTFAAFLARSLRQERLCLILTYRTDELHRRHPLRPLLSELERLERARRIELAPFDRTELAEALADILGAAPDGRLLERLFTRSEGNPLYTEELLAAGTDGRGAAPQSLRDAFMVRIERLTPDAQRIARAVAVGRSCNEATLAAVTGIDRGAVQVALREAVGEQVLVAGADERFGFRHALLREALYDDLLPGERGQLNMALAQYLEQGCEPNDDDELERTSAVAGHYAAAGDQPSALRSTVAAARAAIRVLAYGEATDLTQRALELWPRVDDAERVAGLDHVALLTMAAEVLHVIDGRGRSVNLINEALRELDPVADSRRYADLLARQARLSWSLNRGPEALEVAQRALDMLDESDQETRPRLLAWMARTQFLRGRFREAISGGEQALGMVREAGDRVAENELLNTLGMARVALQDVEGGTGLLRHAVDMARADEDYEALASAYSNLADMLLIVGRTREAVGIAREGSGLTPRHQVQTFDWMNLTVSETSFEAGDWRTAAASIPPLPARPGGRLFMFRQLRAADQALGHGDDEEAERLLDTIAELVASATEPQWIGLYGALRGDLLARRNDLTGGQRAIQEALDRLELCTDDVMMIARVTVVGMAIEAQRAQRGRDLGLPEERRDAVARAKIHADRLAAAAQQGSPVERARLAQGRAELARARNRGSAKEWAAAAEAWEALERPYRAARGRWREAEAHVNAGDRTAATAAARLSRDEARRLGAGWLLREVEGLAGRARLELDAGGGNGAPQNGRQTPAEGPADPFGLTPRELQVLALLAQGATNRQIGAKLFMAEKTASVHVSRILAKLDVHSRTQAAAVAHRLQLT